uniref:Dolichyl-diphosphooligosaccharide--protein glycosyltransferase subunit KCP2 n=1 Tax=Rhabditophanes sp. KR3021 TaxID=114890 RepID=A0AC35U0D2_9BILA
MTTHKKSALISISIAAALISLLLVFKGYLGSFKEGTFFGGFIGSVIFMFLLTGISNLKNLDNKFQNSSGYIDITIALGIAVFVSSAVHGVSMTVSFLLSLFWIFLLSNISDRQHIGHSAPASSGIAAVIKKAKK